MCITVFVCVFAFFFIVLFLRLSLPALFSPHSIFLVRVCVFAPFQSIMDLYVPFLPMTQHEVKEYIAVRIAQLARRLGIGLVYDHSLLTFLANGVEFDGDYAEVCA